MSQILNELSLKEKSLLIAGFMDGEGCISIQKNGSVSVGIVNTSKANLEFIQSVFGGVVQSRSQIVNKKQYVYRLYGKDAINFLDTIKDFLIDKHDQAIAVIEYYSYREELAPIRIPGKRGAFANPERETLVEVFRQILSEQKVEEH